MYHQISPDVRVEQGPARREAIATEDVFKRPGIQGKYRLNGPDAMGKRIVAGKPFIYLDRAGPWVWYVYRLEQVQDRDARVTERYVPKSVHEDREAAFTEARRLAGVQAEG